MSGSPTTTKGRIEMEETLAGDFMMKVKLFSLLFTRVCREVPVTLNGGFFL